MSSSYYYPPQVRRGFAPRRAMAVDIPYDPGDSDLIHMNPTYRRTIYPEDRKLRPELLRPAGLPNPIYYPYQRINFENLGYARRVARRSTHPALQQNLNYAGPRYVLPLDPNRRFPRMHHDLRTYPRYHRWG
ncbi:hypothetical protein Mapa_013513 [Marchantia paleacea]|nr:hypothetical protein Mapa_013513 [Marchantia paleacea]